MVGAGAAGLMAAGSAAACGAEVLLLEKMKLPGRKLGISGKGRCNLTNSAELSDFISHFGKNGRFLRQIFSQFFSAELLQLLEQAGIATRLERGGRFFPANGKNAVDVVKSLERWVIKNGAVIKTSTTVTGIITQKGQVTGLKTSKGHLECHKVILATGGASYPATGSTGDGYLFLEKLGHTIIRLRPALVPLITEPKPALSLKGLNLKNVRARLFIGGKRKAEAFGELSFTQNGLAGPIILTMSCQAADAVFAGKNVKIVIDLKPALTEQQLDNRLIRDLQRRHREKIASILRGLMPRECVNPCLTGTEINPAALGGSITAKQRKRLGQWLKNQTCQITGCEKLERAIVTAGGVKLQEIDPKTMASRLVKGLYITGELLDLHGDTGGFNLQAAFSTGWVAGLAAAGADQPA